MKISNVSIVLAALWLSAVLPGAARADKISDAQTITTVFSQDGGALGSIGGFQSEESFTMCTFHIMYIDLSTEHGRAQLSLVLTAKASGMKVVRIDYSVDGNGWCWVYGLHVN